METGTAHKNGKEIVPDPEEPAIIDGRGRTWVSGVIWDSLGYLKYPFGWHVAQYRQETHVLLGHQLEVNHETLKHMK